MTGTTMPATTATTTGGAAHEMTVLHVVECLSSGVATALTSYITMTPEVRHVVLGRERDAFSEVRHLAQYRTAEDLPTNKLLQPGMLRRTIEEIDPDVVHAHSSWAGTYGRIVPTLARVPRVYSPHGFSFLRTDVPGAARGGFRAVERLLAPLTTAFVTAGAAESERAVGLRRGAPTFEAVAASPSIAPGPAGAPKAGVVTSGRVSAQKDPVLFVAVVDELRRRGWDGPVRWVGGGDERLVALLRAHDVEVTGWVTREESIDLLRGGSVYLHTAAWEASIPYSVLEAAAVGLPVVARHLPEMTDRPGLTLATSPAGLAASVQRFLDSEEDRARAGLRSARVVDPSWVLRQRDGLLDAYRFARQDSRPAVQVAAGR